MEKIERNEAELSLQDLEQISGGDDCTYAGQSYSPGSKIKPVDETLTCRDNGTWG